MRPTALIFDVDGTLAETEEVHRLAFGRAFAEHRLDWNWDVALYRDLLKTTGGRERIRRFCELFGITPANMPDDRVAALHRRKNEIYGELIASGACAARPGVVALVETARSKGLRLAIATTTSRANVAALLPAIFGAGGEDLFETWVCGEDVAVKKPAPDAYVEALRRLALPAEACLAFEDSANGVASATTAGLATIATPSLYTAHETFDRAAAVLPDLAAFDLAAWLDR